MFAALGINLDIIVIALLVLIVVLIVTLAMTIDSRIKLARIMKNCSSGRLDEAIVSYYNNVEALAQEIKAQAHRFVKYENNTSLCVQKVGCVRYNAFSDMGSDLSYSIAILDQTNTGFVLTGIFGRDHANTYLKPITAGNSSISLSEEEKHAISEAISNYNKKHME
ncbi:MAG: hypothetical protein BWY15_01953 [Firmicutes bacterium ADurb.Bin193]|nr:MAG: hypothetical protein BWY15_01953 [Firmicutes bacterium ADurb.Bin193]